MRGLPHGERPHFLRIGHQAQMHHQKQDEADVYAVALVLAADSRQRDGLLQLENEPAAAQVDQFVLVFVLIVRHESVVFVQLDKQRLLQRIHSVRAQTLPQRSVEGALDRQLDGRGAVPRRGQLCQQQFGEQLEQQFEQEQSIQLVVQPDKHTESPTA